MLSSFTGALTKLKETKLVQNLSSNYNKLRVQMNKKMEIVEIIPNLFHISYPEEEMLPELKKHIGEDDYQLWNIGEYRYSQALESSILEEGEKGEKGEIHHLCFQYYSNLPLYELIIAINSIHYFQQVSSRHKVYLHCQDNRLRSSVFLACFIHKFDLLKKGDISQAILYVNSKLGTTLEMEQKGSQTANYNNLHLFFKNYNNFLNSPKMVNKNKLQLLKMVFSDAPQLRIDQEVIARGGGSLKQLQVCVQIRSKEVVIQKGVYDSTVFEGDSMCIQVSNRSIILSDDFLVVVKYIYQGKAYAMMRIQLNTNFIFDQFHRAHQQSIDLSSFCSLNKNRPMFIDFIFEGNYGLSDLARLQEMPSDQIFKLSKKYQPKENDKKELETKDSEELKVETTVENFSLLDHEDEDEEHEVGEHQINQKIEALMKNINNKPDLEEDSEEEGEEEQGEGGQGQDQEQKGPEGSKDEEEDDLEDYLSKLESQV